MVTNVELMVKLVNRRQYMYVEALKITGNSKNRTS